MVTKPCVEPRDGGEITRYLLAVNFQGGVETPMEEVEAGGDYRTSELLQGAAQMTGNPSVTLSRAVAAAMADGPSAGLAVLDTIEERQAGPRPARRGPRGLVDELPLMIGAAVLGGGTPAFGGPGPALELIDVRHRDGAQNVLLRYQVLR
jgi:hypothetical protein